jgi:hypothetical protein
MKYDELLKFAQALLAENNALRKQITFLKDSHDAMRELAYKTGAEEEREACARVAELVAREIDDTNGTATYISKAIRARGEKCPT